ncbi:unnamed protein product [Enterobius vermicularis]|uniref:HAD family phosphatase n=1 Tax=Enterobius vermicularis TaxID=51028 RepID=A0A0N4UY56_ENTVE|nr:unnamed protein product [Enterobius vermicularis]
MGFKAVIFDASGVTLSFEKIPYVVDLFKELKKNPDDWKQFEDLELGIGHTKNSNHVFEKTFAANPHFKQKTLEVMKNESYFSLFDNMVEDKYIAAVLPKLKNAGLKTCMLTNNMFRDETRTEVYVPETVLQKFDAVVVSCRDRCRKPNKDCFELACKRLGVELNECIFIDDFPENCEGARKFGITAIQVHGTDTLGAVKELEKLLGLKLL